MQREGVAGGDHRIRLEAGLMKTYKLYAFDLDGVLFRGSDPISGAIEAIQALRETRAHIRFLTNNSSYTRVQHAEKLSSLGFQADAAEVVSSASVAANLLSEQTVYVVGEPGLHEELRSEGCRIVTQEDAGWVVVGIKWNVTYDDIDEAQWRIRSGAKFLATNLDATYPLEGGRLRPGAGSIVAAVATAAGKTPDVVAGKPSPKMILPLLAELSLHPDEALIVGDRVDTDVACARAAGCDSLLVLSGVTTNISADARPRPTYVLPSVAGMLG